MTSLGRQYAERIANEAAANADPNGDLGLEYQAADLVLSLFGGVWKNKAAVDRWDHVDYPLDAAGSFSIARKELRQAAEQYLESAPWLHNRHFDWTIANMLAYAELDATLLAFKPSLNFSHSPGTMIGIALGGLLWKIVKWALFFAAAIAAFSVSGWLGSALVALTIFVQATSFIQRRKRSALMASMLDVYTSLKSASLSWAVVWALMSKSRDLGAVWDPELYRLVEMRTAVRTGS